MSSERLAIDLTNCDREPIHVPGAIQPHGEPFIDRTQLGAWRVAKTVLKAYKSFQ